MRINTDLTRCPLRPRRRGGNAVLEMAIALPILMYLAMGLVEYGQYFYLKQAFEAAARDGCRVAITPSATQAQIVSAISATLSESGVTYNPAWAKFYWVTAPGVNVAESDVSGIVPGYAIQVVLSAQYSTLPNAVRPLSSLIPAAGIGTGKQITGTSTMIKE